MYLYTAHLILSVLKMTTFVPSSKDPWCKNQNIQRLVTVSSFNMKYGDKNKDIFIFESILAAIDKHLNW